MRFFMVSRIFKSKLTAISQSYKLRLVTLPGLIILGITKKTNTIKDLLDIEVLKYSTVIKDIKHRSLHV